MPTSSIHIPNDAGLKLAIVVQKPEGSGQFPTVLMFHGFKGYKEEVTYTYLADLLERAGIASVRFDASGFGASEGSLEDDYRFSNYITDSEAVYRWLMSQDFVDVTRIAAIGQSMGAAQAIYFGSHHPELQAVCAISPPDVIGTDDIFGGETLLTWKANGYLDTTSSYTGGAVRIPYEYYKDVRQYDFRRYAAKLKVPFLVVIGLEDTTVMPDQSRRVYESATEPKRLLTFDGMDHAYKNDPDMLKRVNESVISYLLKDVGILE